MTTTNRRVLVTGGGTFLGDNIAAALLAEGAEVTLLVRPGAEDKLGGLAQHVRWATADVWNPASLRGRARGHSSVIHTVGSLIEDTTQGLNHHYLNFVSARNVANMCISDGVPHMVFISGVAAPWTSRAYIRAKREAEVYIGRVGLQASIVRAPLTYVRGRPRPFFFRLMTLLGSVPPLSWLLFGRIAPMPVDLFARGVARLTLERKRSKIIYHAPDLRKRNTRAERRAQARPPARDSRTARRIDLPEEETPFGWTPPEGRENG
ncbi:MAG: SDR family oxidoreductase [Chloroflexi bacterium]|nr:SDR family oxidoreductase [Chloroflexota bacterium]